MAYFDVFNGDADGICSLHQLRLVAPRAATLVTGVKRDIELVGRVAARTGDSVTVLDVSLDTNHAALVALLANGVRVEYFDHHHAGVIPDDPLLTAVIDTSPSVCTGILVDRHLGGAARGWAVVAAFGDALDGSACALAASMGLDAEDVASLRSLGEALAYNAYGDAESDLIVAPLALYRALEGWTDPLRFAREAGVLAAIDASRRDDLARAAALEPTRALAGARVFVLPDAGWSRRIRGILANRLAAEERELAHAVLTPDAMDGFVVSLRAPLARPEGADRLCRTFATGGGRSGAAGINHLPRTELDAFTDRLGAAWPRPGEAAPA
jgi:single-stranded DNA-specific DHH superfamily exonuclease